MNKWFEYLEQLEQKELTLRYRTAEKLLNTKHK